MAKGARVAVVLPACNSARTLGAAIESILWQTFEDWRLYVVVDRSEDQTLDIAQRYTKDDTRVTVIEKPMRSGLAAALNVGWRAGGELLVARADADDVCMSERLARQVDFLDVHPEVDVLGTGCALAGDDGRSLGEHRRPTTNSVLFTRIFKECPFMHPTVMMRRSFLERLGGYDERLRVAEDYDLWLRGATRHTYANLHDLLVRYTVSESSASTRWSHTFGAAGVIWRNGWNLGRGHEGVYYSLRYLLAGTLNRLQLRQRYL